VTKRVAAVLVLVLVVVPALFVLEEAIRTLGVLDRVERARDTWQRPDEIIRQLNLTPGNTVVDLGSGAGYFSLKIALRVAPTGRVLAVDLRRESLAFLWIRSRIRRFWRLRVIRGQVDDPRLPPGPVDAVLIANTYHELSSAEPILKTLYTSMRPGARLVVVDRVVRTGSGARPPAAEHHEMAAATAERQINQQGFQTVLRENRFIDRPGDDDVWWLLVFRKP
jgi:predicted methyltransferase